MGHQLWVLIHRGLQNSSPQGACTAAAPIQETSAEMAATCTATTTTTAPAWGGRDLVPNHPTPVLPSITKFQVTSSLPIGTEA